MERILNKYANDGWELAAPVVQEGNTTALIFRREKK
jgi:hypothetical protein